MKRFDDKKKRKTSVSMTFVLSAVIASFVLIVFSLIFSFLIVFEVLPESYIGFARVLSCFIASGVSAYLSAKVLGRAALTSLVQAIANIAFAYIAGTVIFMRIVPQNLNLFIILAFVFGAVLGGFSTAVIRLRRHKIK